MMLFSFRIFFMRVIFMSFPVLECTGISFSMYKKKKSLVIKDNKKERLVFETTGVMIIFGTSFLQPGISGVRFNSL